MSLKLEWHAAYVLHARDYRETSLLVDLFTAEHGRITVVARGAKRGKTKDSGLLQPFIPLQISWYGNSELVTLTAVEPLAPSHSLLGKSAICGLYLNELLVRLMHKWDPYPELFTAYINTLHSLESNAHPKQVILRKFEMLMLKALGYGLQLTREVDSGMPVEAQQYYSFDPVLGPKSVAANHVTAIKGASLLALEAEQFADATVLLDIKRLMRAVLSYHLGARRLVTRELL